MELDLELHAGQLEVFNSRARFKVVVAGRRWGKTHEACVEVLTEVLRDETVVNGRTVSLKNFDVWYVAPTFDQAKGIFWRKFKDMAGKLIKKTWENECRAQMVNGRYVEVMGSDRENPLRGRGLSYAAIDEYATMKANVWEEVISPMLVDVAGGALFIGSPAGKNHFYDIYLLAMTDPDWSAHHFTSLENPFLPSGEIDFKRRTMSSTAFMQEFEASFYSGGQRIFNREKHPMPVIEADAVNPEGLTYIAVDPSGFTTLKQEKRAPKSDETAIAVVSVHRDGWDVHDIIHGRWGVRETSIQILNAARKYKPVAVGIESGMARNALSDYLQDQMRRLRVYPNIVGMQAYNKKVKQIGGAAEMKASRVAWGLQGRLEHGRIRFVQGDYLQPLENQLYDFPDSQHDDMVDALAYIDQIATTLYVTDFMQDSWEPLDAAVGL